VAATTSGCVAVIPARGGSKGIAGKNLRTVGSVPLVVRAVRAALGASRVDRVVVTTDDPEIARVAAEAGAEIVERPVSLAGDAASSESAVVHALDSLGASVDQVADQVSDPEVCVMVQCTSPFVSASDVDGVVSLVADGGADCAFTAVRSHAFLWAGGADGATGVNHDPAGRLRRQDRPPELRETGAAYAMRTVGLRSAGHRFFGTTRAHLTDPLRSIEVDEPADLVMAEALAPLVDRQRLRDVLPARVGAVVFDFDGVMTDDRALVSQDGHESVTVSRADGLGIERLHQAGMAMLVISKERNPVVSARAGKLGLEVLQAIDDKWTCLSRWLDEQGVVAADAVYVGNDVNDVDCLTNVGCGLVVADAHRDAARCARLVLSRPGGRGAVREVADAVVEVIDPSR
jgi:YrbI family 3-deoxy-D-manno-octulosonate 8-phosphate phosphatase